MVTDKIKQLEATRAKLAALEQSVASELHSELAGLPAKYGFESIGAFVKAVKDAGDGRRGRRAGKASPAGKKGAGRKKRRTRAVITDETRAGVKKLVEAGKTGGEIAKALGISLPSVQNIKKALGLVKKK